MSLNSTRCTFNADIEYFSASGDTDECYIIQEGAVKWEQNKAKAELWPFPRHLGPRKYLLYCEIFMAPLLSEMNFAQGGGGVIMMCVFMCMCV